MGEIKGDGSLYGKCRITMTPVPNGINLTRKMVAEQLLS